jgi:aminopeptidase N
MFSKYAILSILLILSISIFGESDPDWVDQEIELKRRLLEYRRRMAKSMSLNNRKDYDVGYYGLDINVDISNEKISGTTTIRGKSRIDELSYIFLDLMSSMQIDSVGSDACRYSRSGDGFHAYFSTPLDSGDVFEIQISYAGYPEEGGFQGFAFNYHSGIPIVSTLSEPYGAHSWFPCKDLPSDKADSADIIVTVPDTLTAVSNGILVSVVNNQDGTATFTWQERYPIAVYLISLAISNYAELEHSYTGLDGTVMPIKHWYFPEYASKIGNLSLTSEMIGFFASIWGEYPFINEKYGHAQFSWGGGMEHQTCTSLGSYSELLICHELAHQWWGNMVTCANWKNIWLNEGFARYSEALWKEHNFGANALKDYMDYLNRPEVWQNSPIYITDTTNVYSIFNRLVYDKGAWVLHMLRHIVGEEVSRDIFPAYRAAYFMDVATTADFQRICEQVYGEDLDWFFNQWIYQIGQPNYKVSWSREQISVNDWVVTVDIEQAQYPQNLFRMPLDVRVEFLKSDTILTINDSLFVQQFEFRFADMPVDIEIDPGGWVLKSVQYSMIDPDLGYIPDRFLLTHPYPNPFNAATHFKIYLPYNIVGELKAYDITGRVVDVIESGAMPAGYHQKTWRPKTLPSGVYIIRLESDNTNLEQKVVYMK